MKLPANLIDLLHQASPCYVTTLMPDGSPQMTQTWVDTDGEHIVINTVQGFQKVKNLERDPRVAVGVSDPSNPSRYYAIRGRVVNITTEGGAEHIEALAQRYLGGPYPWYGGRDQVRASSLSARTRSTRWARRSTSGHLAPRSESGWSVHFWEFPTDRARSRVPGGHCPGQEFFGADMRHPVYSSHTGPGGVAGSMMQGGNRADNNWPPRCEGQGSLARVT